MNLRRSVHSLLLSILLAGCSTHRHPDKIQSIQLVKSTTSWNGQPLPAYVQGTPEVTILRITIPPGFTLPMHQHPVINAGVLIRGKLTVVTESGDVLHMTANDPIVEVVDTWHYGKNEGRAPAEILVFYAGAVGTPLSIIRSTDAPGH